MKALDFSPAGLEAIPQVRTAFEAACEREKQVTNLSTSAMKTSYAVQALQVLWALEPDKGDEFLAAASLLYIHTDMDFSDAETLPDSLGDMAYRTRLSDFFDATNVFVERRQQNDKFSEQQMIYLALLNFWAQIQVYEETVKTLLPGEYKTYRRTEQDQCYRNMALQVYGIAHYVSYELPFANAVVEKISTLQNRLHAPAPANV